MSVTTGIYSYGNGLSHWWMGHNCNTCHNEMSKNIRFELLQSFASLTFQTTTSMPLKGQLQLQLHDIEKCILNAVSTLFDTSTIVHIIWVQACLLKPKLLPWKIHVILPTTDLYYVPDTVGPIYFYQIVKTRRFSLAYLLKWRKFWLMHLCRSVDVSTYRISRLIPKQTGFNWANSICLG